MEEVKNKPERKARRKPSIDMGTMVYGKVPPQAKDVEAEILGNCMDSADAFLMASEYLRPECFYVEAHQIIFRAMINLNAVNSPVDVMTVIQQLTKQGEVELVGGVHEILKLNNTVVKRLSESHCLIVLENYMKREMIRLAGETIGDAYDDETDVFELIDQHEKALTAITSNTVSTKVVNIDEAIVESLTKIQELRARGSSMTGVPSGYKALDQITHGWQATNLIILAARPSVGKTAFALNLARNAAKNAAGAVMIFSLEMSRGQLVNRMLAAESGIHLEKVANGMLNDAEMFKLGNDAANLSQDTIIIDDTPAINIFQMRSKLRATKRKRKLILVIIDYLQLMSGTSEKQNIREQEISKISRDLKGLAKELQVPIIALSQLSRDVEKRKDGNKMPVLSDLRESGAIEQDADDVLFLYRPEYYDITSNEMGESNKGETHVKIAKHRNGRVGDIVKLTANLAIQKFYDFDGFEVTKDEMRSKGFRPLRDITGDNNDDF